MPTHSHTKVSSDSCSPGGPLKRTGSRAEEWDAIIGPSLDAIPCSQLPLAKTILQRYRALRIVNVQQPITELAKQICKEVTNIWEQARVPTAAANNCYKKIHELILEWNKQHNPGEVSDQFVEKLNSLLDLKPKLRGRTAEEDELENLRNIMRQNAEVKRRKIVEGGFEQYDWEADYNFYIDQYKVTQI